MAYEEPIAFTGHRRARHPGLHPRGRGAGCRTDRRRRPLDPRRVPWIERSEAPWIILGAAALLIAALILFPGPTVAVSATPASDVTPVTTVDAGLPIWTALAIPVPESLRTHTANVAGSVDVLEIADLGPGAALSYTGNVTTVDGAVVQQLFDEPFRHRVPHGRFRRRLHAVPGRELADPRAG